MHRREAERRARRLAIERQAGRAVARRGTERALRRAPVREPQALGVVAKFRGEAAGPERHRTRHRLLHVGVARQHRPAFARRERIERVGHRGRARAQLLDGVAQVEAQRREHLVVARAAEVHPPAGLANSRGKALLERGLPVFVGELDVPLAARVGCAEGEQAAFDRAVIGVGQELLCAQHRGMRDRRRDVVAHEPLIERVVLARRVGEDARVERRALVPEACHAPPPCCSAVLSALMSATISVPVPSLVNTSARMLSGEL